MQREQKILKGRIWLWWRGVFRGQFIVPWCAVECQVIHQRTMVLYEVQVDITTGDVTQIRVLTDNKITKFNIK